MESLKRNLWARNLLVPVLCFSFVFSPLATAFAQQEAPPPQEPAEEQQAASSSESEEPLEEEGGGGGESLLDSGNGEPIIEQFDDNRLSHAKRPEVSPDENTGALRYIFPIVTPPGRNGLGADLSLIFDSSLGKNEYFGLNWATNIPYIEKINRTGVEDLHDEGFPFFYSSLDGRATFNESF